MGTLETLPKCFSYGPSAPEGKSNSPNHRKFRKALSFPKEKKQEHVVDEKKKIASCHTATVQQIRINWIRAGGQQYFPVLVKLHLILVYILD